jgi:hypothetical protein
MIPLTIPETKRLLATTWHQPKPTDHETHWRNWRRRHQARARWFHQRTRLNREYSLASQQMAAAVLGGELLSLLSLNGDRSLPILLSEAIERIADAHRDTCDLADPSSPSATVTILRLSGGHADYLVLGDSVLVLDRAGDPLVVSDPREVALSQPYRTALEAAAEGSVEYEQVRSDFIDVLRANRNRPGGFWVAKEDPRAAVEAITGSCAISEFSSAVLLSNGASRIVDRFQLAQWPNVLDILTSSGPATIIRRVREEEARRVVAADDATIAYCTNLSEC